MKVGFVGLGNMGAPMAGWLLKAGFPLVVHDVRAEAAADLVERGATWADSPGNVAEQCDVVATCLPGPSEMEAVTLGRGGIVAKIQPDAIYIDHTTNSPEVVRMVGVAIGERSAHMLDVPVDGGREGALAGDMTLFAGGDETVVERARPVLECYSSNIAWVGELGTGSITKIVHNALAMSIDFLVAECLTLGAKGGVEATPADRGVSPGERPQRQHDLQQAAAADPFSRRLLASIRAEAGAQGLRAGG